MSYTTGTNSQYGVPVTYYIGYNGQYYDWAETRLLELNDISNSSDPFDNKRKISNAEFTLQDTDGAVWALFGNGTSAFNKAVTIDVYVGGLMESSSLVEGARVKRTSLAGAYTERIHTGNITNVSKRGRAVTVRSENKLGYVDKLDWIRPVQKEDLTMVKLSASGTDGTCVDARAAAWNEILNDSAYNVSDSSTRCTLYGYLLGTTLGFNSYQGTGIYQTGNGGTLITGFLGTKYQFVDNNFVNNFSSNRVEVDGSLYNNGSVYFDFKKDVSGFGTVFYREQKITLQGAPVGVLKHLLFGKFVLNYLSNSTDMEEASFADSAKITAFQNYQGTAYHDDKVQDYIDEIINTNNAMFYVNSNNKFAFRAYGPLNLQAALGTIGSSTGLLESSFENDINDWYNKVELEYDWDGTSYKNRVIGTSSDYTALTERKKEISSKLLVNGNQATIFLKRFMKRLKNTVPKIHAKTILKYAGADLGTLMRIVDGNSSLNNIVQCIEYSKGFAGDKQIGFTFLDGDSLFSKKGYALWEGDNNPDAVVSDTSTSGWGTTLGATTPQATGGICFGINTSLYGTIFNWW